MEHLQMQKNNTHYDHFIYEASIASISLHGQILAI